MVAIAKIVWLVKEMATTLPDAFVQVSYELIWCANMRCVCDTHVMCMLLFVGKGCFTARCFCPLKGSQLGLPKMKK